MSRPLPNLEGVVTLADRREIAYAEFGDPRGRPIFWFHGTPGARLQIPPDGPEAAVEFGFRILSVERPGTGGSTHAPSRTLVSWAGDVAECADALEVDRFAAVGLSGGGPFVLACAHQLPERVVAGALLGGLGPISGPERAPGYPALLSGVARAVAAARRPLGAALSPLAVRLHALLPRFFDVYARYGAGIDREVLERPDLKDAFVADLEVAVGAGVRGLVHDLSLLSRPWPFSPGAIGVPIRLWHGSADPVVPLAHAEYLFERLPRARLFVLEGDGHFAGFTRMPEVLADLLAVWRERAGPVR